MNTLASQGAHQKYRGRRVPFAILRIAPLLVVAVVISLALGYTLVPLIAITILATAFVLFFWLGTIVRHYVVVDYDNVHFTFWNVVRHVPMEKITEAESDDIEGTLRVWFKSDAGERDMAGFQFARNSDASAVRDLILARARQAAHGQPQDHGVENEPPLALPREGERLHFQIQSGVNWLWAILAVPVLFGVIVAEDGISSIRGLLVLAAICLAVGTLIFLFYRRITGHLFIHPSVVDVRNGEHQSHRMRFNQLLDVEAEDNGYLKIEYMKDGLLGVGGGKRTAVINLKRHSDAKRVQRLLLLARDQAKAGDQRDGT